MSFSTWPRLWVCADLSHSNGEAVLTHTALALESGALTVWLRVRGVSGLRAYGAATVLRALTLAYASKLIVGDRLDVALASGADGVHLGEDSLSPTDVRALAVRVGRDNLVVTRTAHDEATIDRWRTHIDALLVSPFATVAGKGHVLGPEVLRERVIRAQGTPVVALGGITDEALARSALDAGAWSIATRRLVCDGVEVTHALDALHRSLDPMRAGCERSPR